MGNTAQVCDIVSGQRYMRALTGNQRTRMLDFTTHDPAEKERMLRHGALLRSLPCCQKCSACAGPAAKRESRCGVRKLAPIPRVVWRCVLRSFRFLTSSFMRMCCRQNFPAQTFTTDPYIKEFGVGVGTEMVCSPRTTAKRHVASQNGTRTCDRGPRRERGTD